MAPIQRLTMLPAEDPMPQQSNLPTTAASPPGQRQRRWRWPLVAAVLVCLMIFLPNLSFWYNGDRTLGTVLSKQLHTPVTVAGVAGGWLSGLELRGIEVAESPEPQAPLLLRPSGGSLNLAAVWLLASSDPIALRLEELTVNLRRRHDGQWNIVALLAHLTTPPTPAAPKPSKPLRCPIAALTSH